MKELNGTGVALVTPFSSDGSVDIEGYRRLLDFTGQHVDYWVVLGTTGETATCTAKEKADLLTFTKNNNPKQLPIVYGIGGNNTQGILETIDNTDLQGVTAILSVSPYYNKPSQAGLIAHFSKIADHSPVPIILYNVPGRTGSNMAAETTLALAKHPNIIGVKEASGDLTQTKKIADEKPDDFLLISGEDLLTTKIIEQGGKGVISVIANGFPAEFSKVISLAQDGDYSASQKLMDEFATVNPLLYEESNPVGIKEVLRVKNICGNQVRLPLLRASDSLSERIKSCF